MIEWLTTNWADVFQILSGSVFIASLIVKLTPSEVDDAYLARILKLFEVVALNKKPVERR